MDHPFKRIIGKGHLSLVFYMSRTWHIGGCLQNMSTGRRRGIKAKRYQQSPFCAWQIAKYIESCKGVCFPNFKRLPLLPYPSVPYPGNGPQVQDSKLPHKNYFMLPVAQIKPYFCSQDVATSAQIKSHLCSLLSAAGWGVSANKVIVRFQSAH